MSIIRFSSKMKMDGIGVEFSEVIRDGDVIGSGRTQISIKGKMLERFYVKHFLWISPACLQNVSIYPKIIHPRDG